MKTVKSVKARNTQLEERLLELSQGILDLARRLSLRDPLRDQLVRAGTSGGANYIEACEAVSAKDFVHRIAIARKEMRETIYWLRLVAYSYFGLAEDCRKLDAEANQLVRIFSAILKKFHA